LVHLSFPAGSMTHSLQLICPQRILLLLLPFLLLIQACREKPALPPTLPENIYISWAAHDQLSDTVRLTETLANQQLDAFLLLRSQGVKLDYFLMDMFWFSRHTLYGSFNENWPDGHGALFQRARDNDVKLGLWISANVLGWNENMRWLEYQDTLASSISKEKRWMVMYEGVWPDYLESVLEYWYGEGVSLFKVDFAAFYAVREGDEEKYTRAQIEEMNEQGFYRVLESFRKKHPDCKFIAYNGFIDKENPDPQQAARWLNVFDAIFCGDPQPSLVPAFNFFQSVGLYSDQMFWTFARNGIPVPLIDNSQFMLSKTGTGHYRGKEAWKSMLLSTLAKRSMYQTYYGNLDLLDSTDAGWMQRAQQVFYQMDTLQLGGDYPYRGEPFFYHLSNARGGLVWVVNPGQQVSRVSLPPACAQAATTVLFAQQGHTNQIAQNTVSLGPEQSVLLGYGEYARESYSLGREDAGFFPQHIQRLDTRARQATPPALSFRVDRPERGNLRLVFQLCDSLDKPLIIYGGAPPEGRFMDRVLQIRASAGGEPLPLELHYNRQIWAGLSWAVAEISEAHLAGRPGEIAVAFTVADDKFRGTITESCYQTY
jgi:hypothetical protein